MENIKTLDDFDFKDKTVLVRIDINCPIDPETKAFLDVRRMKMHAKTLKELADNGAKVVVLAHQGRPGSEYDFTTLEKHAVEISKHTEPCRGARRNGWAGSQTFGVMANPWLDLSGRFSILAVPRGLADPGAAMLL